MAIHKTNAMRFLDKNKIPYNTHEYESTDGRIDGVAVAEKLNQNPEHVFKTLVLQGASREFYVFVLPVTCEIDLKKAAKTAGEKSIDMIHVKDLFNTTGYIRGGCSPLAMKKSFKTFIQQSAQQLNLFFFSAGKIGIQIEAKPHDIANAINATFADFVID
ncbi:Cys-tRNA(Pro) deacylase [Candidatus Sumerlaeota bacterium]|nr:Cys-tRNA(Pro) deacylase [Candidatus Sumerlaeales bacterium]NLD62245.1 Cys-tRNA(Pro) deacylase [Candidatus Sumerlaeota bacterium]